MVTGRPYVAHMDARGQRDQNLDFLWTSYMGGPLVISRVHCGQQLLQPSCSAGYRTVGGGRWVSSDPVGEEGKGKRPLTTAFRPIHTEKSRIWNTTDKQRDRCRRLCL